jgi:hypothetical protein
MASETQDELLRCFEEAAWRQEGQIDGNAARLTDEASSPQGSTGLTEANVGGASVTPAGQNVQGGPATEVENGSAGSTAESVLKDVFEGGLGVVPLIGGLLGLFGGGSSSPAPLLKYQMPSSISFTSADTGDGLSAADYDQMGMPRLDDNGPDSANTNAPDGGSGLTGPAATGPIGSATPQITVSVQAMDAQSFLDRSDDIAQAVRSAMLSMNSINDVVNEL